MDARSAGRSVMEVQNPIDFPGSFKDFYLMLLKAFSYFDVTDLMRKLHTQTLLIFKSHIQNPLKVSEDKATTTCLVVNNVPALFNSVCFVEDIIVFICNFYALNSSNCTVIQDHRRFGHSLMGATKLLLC